MAQYTAIVLAGGSGSRMHSGVPKQWLPLLGRPLIFYTLFAFEKSPVDQVVLICRPGEEELCKKQLVEPYGFSKITDIAAGGDERYQSVENALPYVKGDYILVHDGARALITEKLIRRCMTSAEVYHAAVCCVPVKDTVKIMTDDGFVASTPKRSLLRAVQTPQSFETHLLQQAYEKRRAAGEDDVTDDSMVVERMMDVPVRLIDGDYENLKITTPEDLITAEEILRKRGWEPA